MRDASQVGDTCILTKNVDGETKTGYVDVNKGSKDADGYFEAIAAAGTTDINLDSKPFQKFSYDVLSNDKVSQKDNEWATFSYSLNGTT